MGLPDHVRGTPGISHGAHHRITQLGCQSLAAGGSPVAAWETAGGQRLILSCAYSSDGVLCVAGLGCYGRWARGATFRPTLRSTRRLAS